MAGIISNVDSDVQKLRKLKNEIESVKKALKGINIKVDIDIAKGLQSQLTSLLGQYDTLVDKIAAAEGKIMLSASRINKATEKIVKAQEVVSKPTAAPAQNGDAARQTNTAETESVRAQAKAYDDLRTEINNILGTREENVKRMIDEMNAIRLINAEIKKINKSQSDYSSLSSVQQKRLEQLNNSLLTHKTALSEVRQALNNNAKLDNATATSMNGLSQSLSSMRIAYRELTEEERNSPIGKELLASINQADAKIKELDATIGNHQRNVGNYGKQWNGLNMSIQQVGRELPSLAYGPKVFFSAISNNLPILADEIKRARTEYELLKKSGQSATPVWKQVVSSLFSWQTALTIGITLLTLYGDKIVDWIGGLFNITDATKPLVDVQKQLNEVLLKGIQSAQSEITKLDLLYKATQNAAKPIEERKKAIDELQKSYPDFFKNLSDEEILTGKAADAYTRLSSAIIASARARAAQDKMTENAKKILENEEKITAAYTEREKKQVTLEKEQKLLANLSNTGESQEFQAGIVRSAQKRVDEIDKRIANFRREIYETNKAQHELAKNININDLVFNVNSDSTSKQESEAEKVAREAEKLRQQQEKYALLMDKQALEQQRSSEDLQMKVDEARIKAMDEGSEKTIAEMELNFEKEMQVIDRQKEDALRKKIEDAHSVWEADPKNKGKSFDATGIKLSDDEQKYFDELYKAAIANNEKTYSDLADKYQSYTDERLAIEKKFNDDITVLQEARKKAEAKGDTDEVAKIDRSIEKRTETKNEDVFKLDAEQFKKNMDWEQVFGNLDKVSTDTLKKLKANLKDFISAQKNLSPENLKELVDAIERIDDKVSERNPFEAMKTSFKSLKDATDAQREAQKAYNKALKEGTDEEKKNAKATLESAKNSKQKALYEATDALHKGVDEIGHYVDAGNEVISIMETLGLNTPKWLEGTMSGFGEILNGLSNIDLTRPMSIVTGSLQTIKGALTSVISLGGLIPGLGGADYSRYNEMVEEYNKLNSIWDELIDKKKEYINTSYGVEANKVGKEALELAEKSIESYRILGKERLNAGASAGSHSIGIRIRKGMSKEGWQQAREALGADFDKATEGRMTGLFDLSAEQVEKLKEADIFWSKLDDDVREYLQGIIDGEERIKDIQNQIKEQLTQVSFDSVFDSFVDMLMDMDSSAEDFSKNFEQYMQRAILTTMVGNKYKDKLRAWYDSFAKANDDKAGITKEEMEKSQAEWDAIVAEALAERNALKYAMGWTGDSTPQQGGSQRGFGTEMTHEDVGELSGRFTALQIAGEEIKVQSIVQSQSLNLLTAKADAILSINTEARNIADDTRDLIARSYLELVQISENTGAIVKPIQQMQKDIADVKKNTSKL